MSGFGVRAYRMTGNPHEVPKISLAFAQRFGISATRSAILARYWFVMVKSGVQSKAAENSFNAVRLLAALQVAYIHAIAHLKLAPTWGYEWIVQFPGVPIFFAVSGYLVFGSLFRLYLDNRGLALRGRTDRIYTQPVGGVGSPVFHLLRSHRELQHCIAVGWQRWWNAIL